MITLQKQAVDEMTEDALKSFPDECCGFLFGSESGDTRVITEIMVVKNSQAGDKKRRYEISVQDYLSAEDYAEKRNIGFLGIYHSHPNHPAIPSEQDRVAAQPYFSYIILSVINGVLDTIHSWRLNEEFQFEEERIQFNHLKHTTWQR